MSTQHVMDTAGAPGGADGQRQSPNMCEAHDLRLMLSDLASRINEADQRHSKALNAMQERLSALGAAAVGLREQLPADMTPALDRIQDGMSLLAEQIAAAEIQRRPQASSRSELQPAADSAPALRSALAADALDAFARRTQLARNAGAGEHDHFDVVDLSPPARDPDTWDSQAADELARIYESGAAGPVLPTKNPTEPLPAEQPPVATDVVVDDAAPTVVVSAAPEVAPAASPFVVSGPTSDEIASQIAARQAEVLEAERHWLDGRFKDIAARLEQSIAGIGAASGVEMLEARFSGLEDKLAEVLAAAPTRSDFAGLKSIETQVEDLTAQLVTVQTHFSRLDTIELELRSLADRVSTEKLAEIVSSNNSRPPDSDALAGAVASGVAKEMPRIEARIHALSEQLSADKLAALVGQSKPAGIDPGTIARMVADLVSQQMPRVQATVDTAPAIEELRSALETFTAEQRHGDEQINTMLDTMQQAMIRLLDRMDALEQVRYADAVDPAGVQHGYAEQSAYDAQQAGYGQPHSVREELGYRADVPVPSSPYVSAPQSAAYEQALSPTGDYTSAPTARPPAQEPKAADNREDFIAAARRAARMAEEAQQKAVMETEQAPPPEGRKVKINAAPKARRSMSAVSMAMVCLLLVGGGFAAVRTIGLPGFMSPSASQRAPTKAPAPQQKSEADRKVQNLEDADLIIEDDRKASGAGQQPSPSGAPAGPRRSSLDGAAPHGDSFSSLATASLQNAPAIPAAHTRERPEGAVAARPTNPMPPLSIGPTSLRNAAAKGDPSAEYEIGVRYAEGKGVQQDLQQAVSWYQRSAAQGFAPAQYRLGSMYERGLGLKADLARARVWYQRAAEQGVVKAMHNLAVLSAGRDNGAVDYSVAARWFNTAAEHGLTDSQFNLAIMHDSGLGMERDAKKAYKWFSLAARTGDEEAARRRESLKAKLTPSEVAEVENEIRMWRPKQATAVLNDPRQAGEMWKQRSR